MSQGWRDNAKMTLIQNEVLCCQSYLPNTKHAPLSNGAANFFLYFMDPKH